MDSTMMYLHVKKTGNESVDPVKNLQEGMAQDIHYDGDMNAAIYNLGNSRESRSLFEVCVVH